MNRALLLLPLATFAIVLIFAVRGLTLDPASPPSTLIDRPLPSLTLAPLDGYGDAFAPGDLQNGPSLVNVFGSWCVYCTVEHPFLMELAERNDLPIFGIDWRDPPGAGEAWLQRNGNPYAKVGADPQGLAIMELGVTGAPETFLVDAEGVVRLHHRGPIDERVWRRKFAPALAKLRAAPAGV